MPRIPYADGKVKVELGDDPDRTGQYTFGFTLHNLTDVEQKYSLCADLFTQGWFEEDGYAYMDTRDRRFTWGCFLDRRRRGPGSGDGHGANGL